MEVVLAPIPTNNNCQTSVDGNHDLEANISIERDLPPKISNQSLEIENVHESGPVLDSMMNSRQIFQKAKEIISQPWDEIQEYLKSITAESLENFETQIMSLGDTNSLSSLDGEHLSTKKLIISDLAKLGFKDSHIRDTLIFHESLPDDLTKEEALRKTLEHLLRVYEHSENETDVEKKDDQKDASINNLNGSQQLSGMPVVNLGDALYEDKQHLDSIRGHFLTTIVEMHVESTIPDEIKEEKDMEAHDIVIGRNNNIKDIVQALSAEKLESSMNKPGMFTCPICYRTMPEYFVAPLLRCDHTFCDKCYVVYLKEQIDNNKVLDIPCPYDGCTEKFEDLQIEKVLPFKQMERYVRFKKGILLSQNPNLRWCTRPGCDKYLIGKKGRNKLTCECGTKICFKCGNEYHSGKSCQTVVDNVYKKYARDKHLQNCPRCKARTEKDGGCNHITCSACKHQWCWLCRKDYTFDHFAPSNQKGCPGLLHAQKVPEAKKTAGYNFKRIFSAIGYFLILPLIIIITALQVPHYLHDRRMKKRFGSRYAHNSNSAKLRFRLSLIGLVLFPIFLIGVIMYGFYSIAHSCKKRGS